MIDVHIVGDGDDHHRGDERIADPDTPEWMTRGQCWVERIPVEVFYPERGEDTYLAIEICHRCPVRVECLEYALDNRETFGVWGGHSERSRRRLRRRRQKASAA